jgi:DNA-directed RNA polymerase subunit beta
MTLRSEDLVNSLKYMFKLRSGEGYVDDIDHLGNRRLRTIDELAAEELRKGFLKLKRTVQERMSLKDPNEARSHRRAGEQQVHQQLDRLLLRSRRASRRSSTRRTRCPS